MVYLTIMTRIWDLSQIAAVTPIDMSIFLLISCTLVPCTRSNVLEV